MWHAPAQSQAIAYNIGTGDVGGTGSADINNPAAVNKGGTACGRPLEIVLRRGVSSNMRRQASFTSLKIINISMLEARRKAKKYGRSLGSLPRRK